MTTQNQEQAKRVISIQPAAAVSPTEVRRRALEADIVKVIEQLPMLDEQAWAKIQFMLDIQGSLYRRAQIARCRASLELLGPARNTPAWTAEDDYLAYDLYLSASREALDALIRAESLLGHLEPEEEALFDDLGLDKPAQLEIYLSWLKRRFAVPA